jgi:hypothetical protein
MRSYIINKILCLEYRLRKVIGVKNATRVCSVIEKAFSGLFGRESYRDQG